MCQTAPSALSQPEKLALARDVFRRFHAQCFWYMRKDLTISAADLPAIAEGLRKNGGREGFLLAAKLCR